MKNQTKHLEPFHIILRKVHTNYVQRANYLTCFIIELGLKWSVSWGRLQNHFYSPDCLWEWSCKCVIETIRTKRKWSNKLYFVRTMNVHCVQISRNVSHCITVVSLSLHSIKFGRLLVGYAGCFFSLSLEHK